MDNRYIMFEKLENKNISVLHTADGRMLINTNYYKYDLVAELLDMLTKQSDDRIYLSPEEIKKDWEQWGGQPMAESLRLIDQCLIVERYRRLLMRKNKQPDLAVVKSASFCSIQCDFFRKDNEIWMTREQIGSALEYSEPRKAIQKIHERHKERLDTFSGVVTLGTPSGAQETYIYSARGIYEICRWSQQSKADSFFDWVYDILEGLRKGELALIPAPQQQLPAPPTPLRQLQSPRSDEAAAKLLNARTRQARLLFNAAKDLKSVLPQDELRQMVTKATEIICTG